VGTDCPAKAVLVSYSRCDLKVGNGGGAEAESADAYATNGLEEIGMGII
jgi:GTP cyclohydrolase III